MPDHVESTADEASTSFHTGDTKMRDFQPLYGLCFQQSLREQHRPAQAVVLERVLVAEQVQQDQETLHQAKAAENKISKFLEQIDLGSRSGGFAFWSMKKRRQEEKKRQRTGWQIQNFPNPEIVTMVTSNHQARSRCLSSLAIYWSSKNELTFLRLWSIQPINLLQKRWGFSRPQWTNGARSS